jgi:poly(hydroxyalkanoate) depolymerase family esterase
MSAWQRLRSWLARLWRGAPAPGSWIDGHASALGGWIALAPAVLPRRAWRLYVPAGASRWRAQPLVVLLHGCKQAADAFARGTRIEALADARGAYVLMPVQHEGANAWRCWNWFDARTAAGTGEAAIVLAAMREALRWRRVDADRTIVAGLSAGAGLAAIVGLHHADRVRGVFAHSGVAVGAAASALTALAVLKRGPETDVAATGRDARQDAGDDARDLPAVIVQGLADDVVAPRHAAALARQFLARNGLEVPAGTETSLPAADRDAREAPVHGRAYRVREWLRDGRLAVRLVEVEGLGHAWSGGDASLPFHDAEPPDATAMLGDLLDRVST